MQDAQAREELAARQKLELEAGSAIQGLEPVRTQGFALNYARASDLVRGRKMLPASDVPVGLVENWENSQRSTLPGRNVRV